MKTNPIEERENAAQADLTMHRKHKAILLAALRECLAVIESLDSCECEPSESTCDNCAAMDSARWAIALAEGRE
jgi:hypothetical protein